MLKPKDRPKRDFKMPGFGPRNYWRGVAWIADNDNSHDDETPQEMSGYISILLLADLAGINNLNVAEDVYGWRHPDWRIAQILNK